MDLGKILLKKRPTLGQNSVKTYTSVLKSLHKRVFGNEALIKTENFNKQEEILDSLADKSPTSRKTILSALVVLTDNDKYRQEMLKDIKQHQQQMDNQQMSEKQVKNGVSREDIVQKLKELKKPAMASLKKSQNLTKADYMHIQNYIMLLLMSGEGGLPPRRSLDYTAFKLDDTADKDNYMEGKYFVFNTFKTAKSAGQQKISVPLRTRNLINKWKEVNPTSYLFFDTKLKPMTSVKMTQRLNKIFGKNTSVNALRSSYLSDKFQNSIQIKKDIDATMKKMGSSAKVATTYIKEYPSSDSD